MRPPKVSQSQSAIRPDAVSLPQRAMRRGLSGFARRCRQSSRLGSAPNSCLFLQRFDVYREASKQVQAIFKDYTSLVEPLSLDEAYLDVTDNLRGIPTAWETPKEIRARIYEETSLTASAGISCNKFLAKIASDTRKPNGEFAIMPEQAEAFVATLPGAKVHGVGPKTTARMHALGIETGADLWRQTLDFLQRNFGKAGSWYYEIARGQDDQPVQADRERKSSGSETTFSEDLIDPVQIEAAVIAMADDVWAWCEKTNARGRTVTVKIKWADFQISTRCLSMQMTIQTREKLHQLALGLIRSVFPPPKGIRLVGVTLSNFQAQSGSEAAEPPLS
jgi:DNA polymerase IV